MKKLLVGLSAIFICITALAHSVEWYVDGSLYQTTTCNSGDNITPPTAPEKYGYHFVDWSAYTQLEYIESTGTQWIDTGVDATVPSTSLLSATLDFQATSTTNDRWVFGGYNGNNDFNFLIGSYNGQTIGLYDAAFYRTGSPFDTNRHVVRINHRDGSYWDNIRIGDVKYNTGKNTNMLSLFASHANNKSMYSLPAKIYFCSIMLNDEVIRNFIPCRRNSDNVLGMYDTVSGTFFTNAGTGEFIAGPEVGRF